MLLYQGDDSRFFGVKLLICDLNIVFESVDRQLQSIYNYLLDFKNTSCDKNTNSLQFCSMFLKLKFLD